MQNISQDTNIAQFSTEEGIEIVRENRVMTYLYGLSDFWASMFSDSEKIDLLMGANAITAASIYARFLQLTTGLSIEDVTSTVGSELKLEFIKVSDAVVGEVETYKLSTKVASSRYIVNRPFLPTETLESDVDFYIDTSVNTIKFSKPLAQLKFPFRITADGSKEYSIWLVDARVDSDIIVKNFAKLIGRSSPERITDQFRDYIYGLFYLYVNGPNLDLIKRGLNLVLGIPLVRDDETVLEIRKFLNTDEYIVITDLNSYLIPYGLQPTVQVGDIIKTGQEVASWVEVKDYINDGEWWINFMIPTFVMPHIPAGQNRYATEGSYADWMMQNYLKTHTFLVNVKTVGFKNIQTFEQISSILKEIKPTYTAPIYVWTLPLPDEIIELTDEELIFSKNISWCQSLTCGMYRFKRNSTSPLLRGCPSFTRNSVPESLDSLLGNAPEINGHTYSFNGGNLTGFISQQKQFRELTEEEKGWGKTFFNRGQNDYLPKKGKISFFKNVGTFSQGTTGYKYSKEFPGYRMVCLYSTTILDVINKFNIAGVQLPSDYFFTLFKPSFTVDGINTHAINGSETVEFLNFMTLNFDTFFKKDPSVNYLSALAARDNYRVYTPQVTDLRQGDFLAFVRVIDYLVGVFWVTTNFQAETVPYWTCPADDKLTLGIQGPFSRGMGVHGTPVYNLRGINAEIGYNIGNSLNSVPINEDGGVSAYIDNVTFSDDYNTNVVMDRSGAQLTTREILR